MLLEGSPILMHTVRKFAASGRVAEIVVAVRGEDMEWVREMLRQEFPGNRVRVVEGGDSRQQSVENALARSSPDTDLVAVHDAVRPFIDLETIHKVFDEAAETGAAIVGSARGGHREAGEPRHRPTCASAPPCRARSWCWRRRRRCSGYDLLRRAFDRPAMDGFVGTDESSLVERLDVEVSVVMGSDRNIKITKPGDMDLARLYFQTEIAKEAVT